MSAKVEIEVKRWFVVLVILGGLAVSIWYGIMVTQDLKKLRKENAGLTNLVATYRAVERSAEMIQAKVDSTDNELKKNDTIIKNINKEFRKSDTHIRTLVADSALRLFTTYNLRFMQDSGYRERYYCYGCTDSVHQEF